MQKNKIIWCHKNNFIKWNINKTAFRVRSPFNEDNIFWFNKNYYKNSQFYNYFGIEIPFYHYKTGEQIEYLEYNQDRKIINIYDAIQLINQFKKVAKENSIENKSFIEAYED
ncbi:hypothetical protein [Spiroplasma endosymbiont of Aspidapion aeneum]|uniref:hypothetical protein n=1 Tax=Spiroplasma endosymbiont of Aspidapion aeneum TaxID=3066276 RepID=UPI00313B0170